MAPKRKEPKRGRGRPSIKDDDQVRLKLLHAAAELFASYEYRAVSIRQISAKAGVNTAMVHYYFTDKAGMYNAMMEQVSLPVEKMLNEIAKRDDLSIEEFIDSFISAMTENPWYPIFIVREGIIGEGPIRDATSERLRSAMGPAMFRALENDRINGRLREDLDLSLVTMTLSSMLTFPFLVRPLMEKVLGLSFDKKGLKQLTAHTTDVLLHGIRENQNISREQ
tara:strand:+ start:236 stop:904 length:669 start_codon:yes stop_codon:yes gene_type:complete